MRTGEYVSTFVFEPVAAPVAETEDETVETVEIEVPVEESEPAVA